MDPIIFKMIDTNFFTRRPCVLCGGWTEKDQVLCECEGEHVCERCIIKASADKGYVDRALEERAASMERSAISFRSAIGRVKLPSHAEWLKRDDEYSDAWFNANIPGFSDGELASYHSSYYSCRYGEEHPLMPEWQKLIEAEASRRGIDLLALIAAQKSGDALPF